MNNAANRAQMYKNQQIMTATPAELTLMLYQGAIRFCLECQKAMENNDFEKAHHTNIKVQKIITELAATLDPHFALTADWQRLYEYTNYCLVQANIKKDTARLNEALDIIRQFKDTWQEAMKIAAAENPPQPLER